MNDKPKSPLEWTDEFIQALAGLNNIEIPAQYMEGVRQNLKTAENMADIVFSVELEDVASVPGTSFKPGAGS